MRTRHCPGSSLGCWAGLQTLTQEERPRWSPRPTTQANHRTGKTQLTTSRVVGLNWDPSSKEPCRFKGAWVREKQESREPAFSSAQRGAQALASLLRGVAREDGEEGPESCQPSNIKHGVRFLITESNCTLHISPCMCNKYPSSPQSKRNLIYSAFTPQFDPPSALPISVNGTINHPCAQAKILGMAA